jgi:hypothetical protein
MKKRQEFYDYFFKRFIDHAKGSASKICSCDGIGTEYGEKLRELANDKIAVACMREAFAEGWKAQTCWLQDEFSEWLQKKVENLVAKSIDEAVSNR